MNESNFQHILRVLNTNLDGRVKVMFALTSIKGVGRRFSNIACKKAEVDLNKRCADRPLRLAGRRESRRDRDACLSRLKSQTAAARPRGALEGCRRPRRRRSHLAENVLPVPVRGLVCAGRAS